MKKRKLNSKNPKYMDKSQLTDVAIKRKELICNVPTRTIKGNITKRSTKVAVNAIWYEDAQLALFS